MGTAVIFLTGVFVPSIVDAKISQVFPLMYIALAIFALAFVVILLTKIPENPAVEAKVEEKSQYGPMSFRHFVLGAVAIFIYVGVEVGIPNVLQKWLQNGGLQVESGAEAIAGTVTATYWLLMLVGRLLGAALGAKVSAKSMLTAVSAVGLCLVLGAILLSPATVVNLPVFKGTAGFGLAEVPVNAGISGWIPIFVLLVSAAVMGICGLLIKKFNMKWLETYALAISMVAAMIFAVIITPVIVG